ncbi:hypothetical protein [Pseudomonas chlororaphis]|uniref:hypothetical protein n=1 Tax=Pseudomonas chlororaphis TaxID=587753 RepID=UPI0024078FEF|nr:hypothetical protein [Pseudomonas chlororaphis]
MRHATALNGLLLEDGQLALTATLTGLGCSLLREPLVAPHVASGELETVRPGGRRRTSVLPVPPRQQRTSTGVELYEWIKRSLVRG